jgi:large subunit ribosomal protein L19e
MTDLRNQKRMAASLLGVGRGRVWIDPDRGEDVANAVTRTDMRRLIEGGAIVAKPENANSRGCIRYIQGQKASGRRTGHGSRKGKKFARLPRKDRWMRTIRALRDELRLLREGKLISPTVYRDFYMRAKGGQFRSRAHLVAHLQTEGHLKADVKPSTLGNAAKAAQERKATRAAKAAAKPEAKGGKKGAAKSKAPAGAEKKAGPKKGGKKESEE